MTPREPDRFEAKARETYHRMFAVPMPVEDRQAVLAAALRVEVRGALEQAAQVADHDHSSTGRDIAEKIRARALAHPAAAPAAEEPLGFCDWPGFKDHPHKKQEDHGRSDAEGNPLGCKNWRPAPPSAPATPEKKPFACGADMESDGHLYRCDRGAGHTGSHGERDYAEWTDAEHHDGDPVAPSLLPRVLAALESVGRGVVLDRRGAIELSAELRRYIAGVDGAVLPTPGEIALKNRLDAAEKRIAELEAALATVAAWELPPSERTWTDGTPMSYGAAFGSNGERDFMRRVASKALAARAAARSEGEGK